MARIEDIEPFTDKEIDSIIRQIEDGEADDSASSGLSAHALKVIKKLVRNIYDLRNKAGE